MATKTQDSGTCLTGFFESIEKHPLTIPLDLKQPCSSWEILLNNEKTIYLPENEFAKLRASHAFAPYMTSRLHA